MKITFEIEFLDSVFPPGKLSQFRQCLTEIEQGKWREGKIILTIQQGKVSLVSEDIHLDK